MRLPPRCLDDPCRTTCNYRSVTSLERDACTTSIHERVGKDKVKTTYQIRWSHVTKYLYKWRYLVIICTKILQFYRFKHRIYFRVWRWRIFATCCAGVDVFDTCGVRMCAYEDVLCKRLLVIGFFVMKSCGSGFLVVYCYNCNI